MVRILKFFAYIIFFFMILIYFMPKENIYFYAEKELQKLNIVISDENVTDDGLSLKIQNADIYVKDIKSAKIDEVDVSVFGVYNHVEAKNINLTSAAASFVPVKIGLVSIDYSIINPLKVNIYSKGDFGEAKGYVDLLDKNATILLNPSKIMKTKYRSTVRNFRKTANGEYEYVQTF